MRIVNIHAGNFKEINFPLKASPGRGKLSPQVTDEGAGQQHFTLNTPHPALRATCSPFCRCATFSPGAGEICPQGVKALAPGQAAKVDFRGETLSRQILPVRNAAVQNGLEGLLNFPLANSDFGVMIREDAGCAK